MKLLYIYPELIQCGPTNQSYYLLKGLAEKSIKVSLYTFYRSDNRQDQIDRFEKAGIKVHAFKFSLKGLIQSRRHLATINPDLIHSTTLVADIISYVLGRGYKRFITHRTDPHDHVVSRGKIIGLLMYFAAKFLSNHAYKTISCSNAIFQRLVKNNIKVDFVVQNCVNKNFYEKVSENGLSNLKTKKYFKEGLNIISIGSLSDRKKPFITYEILNHLSKIYDLNVTLTFLGDGPLMSALLGVVPSEKMTLKLPGHVSDVRPFISNANIHFSSSIAEGLPNSVLETLSCGVTNILSDIPEHREFVASANEMVYLFSPNESIDKTCTGLIHYLERSAEISDFDLNKFRIDFSEEKVTSSYMRIYNS